MNHQVQLGNINFTINFTKNCEKMCKMFIMIDSISVMLELKKENWSAPAGFRFGFRWKKS